MLARHKREREEMFNNFKALLDMHDRALEDLLMVYLGMRKAENEKPLAYWYTKLEDMPGYSDMRERTRDNLRFYRYIGNLVTTNKYVLLRTPAFGKKSLDDVEKFLEDNGLHLEMELPRFEENEKLLQHFDTEIRSSENGHSQLGHLEESVRKKLAEDGITQIGELALSRVYETYSDVDIDRIDRYLKYYGLRLAMTSPYQPPA